MVTFAPVAVPEQGEESTADLLLAEITDWVRSEPLQALVQHFGHGAPSGGLAEELAYLDDFTAKAWDFRKHESADPKERNQADADAIRGDDEQLVMAAAEALGLVRPTPPKYDHYDHVVVLGGLVRANLWRTAYAAHLLRQGVTADNVIAISAYRNLAANEADPNRDEFKLLDVFGLPRRDYEWEVMQDGLRRAFDLPEFKVERESGPDAAEERSLSYRDSSVITQRKSGDETAGAGCSPRGLVCLRSRLPATRRTR
jgi:hypothetical protein